MRKQSTLSAMRVAMRGVDHRSGHGAGHQHEHYRQALQAATTGRHYRQALEMGTTGTGTSGLQVVWPPLAISSRRAAMSAIGARWWTGKDGREGVGSRRWGDGRLEVGSR